MKIVFFGSSDFSLTVVDSLFSSDHDVLAVVCSADKSSGRGNKVEYSPVKKWAINHGVHVIQHQSVSKSGEEELRKTGADIFITASFGQILRQNILDIPKHGVVNVHGSLLPAYRGAAPVQWSIINGEQETGITIMQTDPGIDTGDIYMARSLSIFPSDTSDTLFAKMAKLGSECIIEFLDNFDRYKMLRQAQDHNRATYAPMIKGEMSKICFDRTAQQVVDFVRGNCSSSTAYFVYKGVQYKVYECQVNTVLTGDIGSILASSPKSGLVVGCREGAVELTQMQAPNRKRMRVKDYLNGAKIEVGEQI